MQSQSQSQSHESLLFSVNQRKKYKTEKQNKNQNTEGNKQEETKQNKVIVPENNLKNERIGNIDYLQEGNSRLYMTFRLNLN